MHMLQKQADATSLELAPEEISFFKIKNEFPCASLPKFASGRQVGLSFRIFRNSFQN